MGTSGKPQPLRWEMSCSLGMTARPNYNMIAAIDEKQILVLGEARGCVFDPETFAISRYIELN